MIKHIDINGRAAQVLNTLSSGPGCTPHTYELKGGSYVYEIAGVWYLQERGQVARKVRVAQMAKNPHAVALGKKGGRVTSDAKAAASRLNGLKGGRPIKPKP